MKNVVRVKYLEGLNQLWLIGSDVLKAWLKGGGIRNHGEVARAIFEYVKEVEVLGENGVILGACFTNIVPYISRTYGSNLMVFPIGIDSISYVFRDDKEYMIRNRDNPRIICPSCCTDFSANGSILFFKENPFKDCEKYYGIKYSIFQSPSEMKPWSRARRNLVKRAATAGMGSLEAFIEDMPWD